MRESGLSASCVPLIMKAHYPHYCSYYLTEKRGGETFLNLLCIMQSKTHHWQLKSPCSAPRVGNVSPCQQRRNMASSTSICCPAGLDGWTNDQMELKIKPFFSQEWGSHPSWFLLLTEKALAFLVEWWDGKPPVRECGLSCRLNISGELEESLKWAFVLPARLFLYLN